jgi:hypothetical protein
MEKAMHDETITELEKTVVTIPCCWDYAGDKKWWLWSHGRGGLFESEQEW